MPVRLLRVCATMKCIWYVQIVLVTVFIVQAHAQDVCVRLTIDVLGNIDKLSQEGMISSILTPRGEITVQPTVRVRDINIVCEAQHMMEGRYRFTSVVVSFTCFSTDLRVGECLNSSVVNTQQFDLGCLSGSWTPTILGTTAFVQTENPTATVDTDRDTDCSVCVNPNNTGLPNTFTVTSDTHCTKCDNCSEGLQRCYFSDDGEKVCCNYFYLDACVLECPSSSPTPNDKFECVLVDCGGLTNPINGTVDVTNTTYASNASYECDTGFALKGESTRTCLLAGEWSGDIPTCKLCSSVIANCEECMPTTISNSSTLYNCTKCSSGFENVNGTECILKATGCGRGCIIGISLSLLGLLVISGIIVASSSISSHQRKKYSVQKTHTELRESGVDLSEGSSPYITADDSTHHIMEERGQTGETPPIDDPDYDYPLPQGAIGEPQTSTNIAYATVQDSTVLA